MKLLPDAGSDTGSGHRFRRDRKIVRELSFSLSEITPSSIASNRLVGFVSGT